MKDWQQAESLYLTAIEVDPASAASYQAFAMSLENRGEIERARAMFKAGCEINPNQPQVYHAWARMEERQGNHELARSLFAVGFNAAPESTAMLRSWREMEQKLGHIGETADWRVPDNMKEPSALQALGERLLMLGHLIEGRGKENTRVVLEWLARRAREDKSMYQRILRKGGSDAKVLQEWVERRSEEDIRAFEEWFEMRYEEDRKIGSYIFGWNIPRRKRRRTKRKPTRPQAPPEWYILDEMPLPMFEDEFVDMTVDPIEAGPLIKWVESFAETAATRAALTTSIGGATIILLLVSNFLGLYSPIGIQDAVKLEPPSGVDAHLIQKDHLQPLEFEFMTKKNTWN
eukprot:Plantae.Rhodophyta-Purpureofilum_apyrenoidigerum.ctg31226.p1 GENE.Plantae.Rhodophyta-Purpureofilum_apyrenoidigerum.ctg31226~~Plantae.Rhodophyta-Purpureofilum_apyrenoidigerum.ctg31226.p1  ORF type:complete len:346 (-),score=64.20 Plantae.Rhodophyta-Purpureofilum_apyrenoidigerum.ctg31226:563-1600(-)